MTTLTKPDPKIMTRWNLWICLVGLMIWGNPSVVTAVSGRVCLEPLPHRNQFPTSAIFLEPEPLGPCTTPVGTISARSSLQWSNTTFVEDRPEYQIIVDHERWDNQTVLRLGLSAWSDLGIRMGAVRDGGGIADGLIDRFHYKTELPGYDREERGRNKYEIAYGNSTNYLVNAYHSPSVIPTEPVISYRRQGTSLPLPWLEDLLLGWRIGFKLPAKNGQYQINSGRMDSFLGFMADTGLTTPIGKFGLSLHGSVVKLGQISHFVYPQRREIFTGGGTLGLLVFSRLEILVQWLASTQRYDQMDIVYMDHSQHIFSSGLRFRDGNHHWTLGFTEDIAAASEDVSLLFAWRYTPE